MNHQYFPFLLTMQFQNIFKQIDSWRSVFYAWFEAMHTRVDIVLCDLNESDSVVLLEKIIDEIKRVEMLANRFDEKSEVAKINRLAYIEPCIINPELYLILEDCILYNKLSNGFFDVTIHSLNNYRCGINDIVLDGGEKTVFFKNKNVQVDLGGYIKGYALERIKVLLNISGCTNSLINIGNSSIYAKGNHPNGKGWKVNLPGDIKKNVTLFDECLTSSGNAIDHLHILKPTTGEAGKYFDIKSIITENAIDGEVLSTALCVCNPTEREVICNKLQGKLLVI